MSTITQATITEVADWLATQHRSDFAQSVARYFRRNGRMSPAQEAAARRMYDRAHPAVVAPEIVGEACGNGVHDYCDHGNDDEARAVNAEIAADRAEVGVGFYCKGGIVYKAKRSQRGHIYMMQRTEAGEWVYVGSPQRAGIVATDKVTPEFAAAHGVATGICIFCNAELDDRDGLGARVGVGPVCCRNHLGMTQRQLAERLGV